MAPQRRSANPARPDRSSEICQVWDRQSAGRLRVVLVTLYGFEAMGVRALHAFLKSHGCDVQVLFFRDRLMNRMPSLPQAELGLLADAVESLRPDLVGISLFSAMYPDAAQITAALRERLRVPIVWGGYHPTIEPEQCIQVADMICLGEGELPLFELVTALEAGQDPAGIANLWLRRADGVVRNPLRPLIQDLDRLPFFDYGDDGKHYFDGQTLIPGDPFNHPSGRGSHFQAHYVIQTGRGCPFSCSFCSNSVLKDIYAGCGPFVRQRSVGRVIEELRLARQRFPRLRLVTFWDEVFVVDRRWAAEFARAYRAEIGLPFRCSLHPAVTSRELLRTLAEAGLEELVVGIQSGSERVRREVFHRPTSRERLLEMARDIRSLGLVPEYDLIVDNPYETQADRDEALDFLVQLPHPYHLRVFSLTHLPRTALTRRALADGLATELDVEGHSQKSLVQWRMTLGHRRTRQDLHWNAIVVLLSKRFVPRACIVALYRSRVLRRWPQALAAVALVSNWIKTALVGLRMLRRGRISWDYVRSQWQSASRVAK